MKKLFIILAAAGFISNVQAECSNGSCGRPQAPRGRAKSNGRKIDELISSIKNVLEVLKAKAEQNKQDAVLAALIEEANNALATRNEALLSAILDQLNKIK